MLSCIGRPSGLFCLGRPFGARLSNVNVKPAPLDQGDIQAIEAVAQSARDNNARSVRNLARRVRHIEEDITFDANAAIAAKMERNRRMMKLGPASCLEECKSCEQQDADDHNNDGDREVHVAVRSAIGDMVKVPIGHSAASARLGHFRRYPPGVFACRSHLSQPADVDVCACHGITKANCSTKGLSSEREKTASTGFAALFGLSFPPLRCDRSTGGTAALPPGPGA
jgi:hypothetical protein